MKNNILKISLFAFGLMTIFAFSCNSAKQTSNDQTSNISEEKTMEEEPMELAEGMEIAYFASGCFWCVEAVYEHAKGVQNVVSGYSGGHTKNPTYESSNTGRTGHAEAVKVVYDPAIISFGTLIDIYFATQNPTQVNGQGPDRGSQYRSIIFYQTPEEKRVIDEKKAELEKNLKDPVAAEIMAYEKFWVAEDYHQDYERLHPNQSYIQNVSVPRLNKFKRQFPELVKDENH